MGKAARERARRKAEAEAPPELIVVEEPTTPEPPEPQEFETATVTKEPWMCRVKGCTNLALERHEGPAGAVWLCGSCGRIARRNLAEEAAKEKVAEMVAELLRPMAELHQRNRERIYRCPDPPAYIPAPVFDLPALVAASVRR